MSVFPCGTFREDAYPRAISRKEHGEQTSVRTELFCKVQEMTLRFYQADLSTCPCCLMALPTVLKSEDLSSECAQTPSISSLCLPTHPQPADCLLRNHLSFSHGEEERGLDLESATPQTLFCHHLTSE